MGTIPLNIGFVILLAAGLGWLFSNPDKISEFRKFLKSFKSKAGRSQDELRALQGDVQGTNRVPTSAPKAEQFSDLQLNETVEFDPNHQKVIGRRELGLTGLGRFRALTNLGGGQFSPRDEDWSAFDLEEVFRLLSRPEGWYCFPTDQVQALSPEEPDFFARQGLIFCDKEHNQEARSHSFMWRRKKLFVLDVGYVEVEVSAGDLFGIHPGMNIKYMLCETVDGDIVFVANCRAGTDYIWLGGRSLGPNISPYIGKLSRAV